MKLRLILIFFFIFIFCLKAWAQEVWIITSLNWEPYSGAEFATQGNSIQKLRGLLAKKNIRLIVEFFPWKRAHLTAKDKKYVGYFPAWPEEVQEGFTASLPVDWSEVGILKRKGISVNYINYDDLFSKYKTGYVKTYDYPEIITRNIRKYPNNFDAAPSEISLLKKLSIGRHILAVTDPNVMIFLCEREGISNIEVLEEKILQKELVVAFRNDKANLLRLKILNELIENK